MSGTHKIDLHGWGKALVMIVVAVMMITMNVIFKEIVLYPPHLVQPIQYFFPPKQSNSIILYLIISCVLCNFMLSF